MTAGWPCLFASQHQAGLAGEWRPTEVSVQAGMLNGESAPADVQGI